MNKVADRIAAEIRETGAIAFARFMALALYCPNCGYYEREEDMIGSGGDYYTSVSVGGVFGELLACQFAEWLEGMQRSRGGGPGVEVEPVQVVEAGAHGGKLAGDILGWMSRHRPVVFNHLQYWIIEPSARRRAWQEENLAGFSGKVCWAGDVAELRRKAAPPGGLPHSAEVRGVIFSNELLDAMPVHRLGWDAKRRRWFEWGVTLEGDRFVWTRMGEGAGNRNGVSKVALATVQLQPSIGVEVLEMLPDGFSVEVCPAAEKWWREAASVLGKGRLLAIDYGLTADEFFMPERRAGTLRAYYRHRLSSDVLASPGEQDITASVNFSAIRALGESAGLRTEAFQTQAQFLTGIAAKAWQIQGAGERWSPERTRQFQTLTHPEHLGRSFRVLLQSRV